MATVTKTDSARSQLPGAVAELVKSFEERNLLTWASALSFQITTAIVPFLLFGFALIGFLHLDNVWADVAKAIKPHLSPAAFEVVRSTAKKVVTQQQLWWVTIGFALAIWEVSGGIRAIMGGLGEIYDVEERRTWFERIRRSIMIAVVVSALVILAIGTAWLGPTLYGDVGQPAGALLFFVRWIVCAFLLGLATAITVRLAPDG